MSDEPAVKHDANTVTVGEGDEEYCATLRKSVLEAYREEYEDLAADWRSVDGKAQALITASGIFLSATIVFTGVSSQPLSTGAKVLVCLALTALLGAIWFAHRAQIITETGGMPSGSTVDDLIQDVLRNKHGAARAVLLATIHENVRAKWRTSNADIAAKVSEKANDVRTAQWFLAAGLLVFVLLVAARLVVST